MRKRTLLLIVLVLALAGGGGTAILIPRFLVQQASVKPADSGTFVTTPASSIDLNARLQEQTSEMSSTPDSNDSSTSVEPSEKEKQPSSFHFSPPKEVISSKAPLDMRSPSDTSISTHTETRETQTESPRPFTLQISENEVAGLIYNGIQSHMFPQYRPAIEGVSVRLSEGRGKITMALNPRHLPDEMLRSLPGMSRNSPVIYMGGEVEIAYDQQTIRPIIRNISVGNLKVPYGLIKGWVNQDMQPYIQQLLNLDASQQTVLKKVTIENGYLLIQGQRQ